MQAGPFAQGQQPGSPGQPPPGYFAAGTPQAGPAPAGQFAPGWTGTEAPGPGAPRPGGGASPTAGSAGQSYARHDGPGSADGPAGKPRSRPSHPADADPDRILTPTTIFAPGSLVNPPDGGEGSRPESHPFAGPGAAPPGYGAPSGYAPFSGQGPWSAPGAGPAGGGFAGPGGGYPPGPAPGPGMFPGPGGSGGGPGYGGAGYQAQAPGYGPPGFDHPYPGDGGVPYGNASGPVPPRFAGGAGHGAQPGQQFPGQPPVPPGYTRDTGQGPRPQAQGRYRPDGVPPYGETRGPDGYPLRGAPGPAGPGQAGYASPGYPGPGAFGGPGGFPRGNGFPGPAGQAGSQGRSAFPGQAGYADGFEGRAEQQAPYAEYQAWQARGGPGGYVGPEEYGETVNGGGYASVIREDDAGRPPNRRSPANTGSAPPGSPQRAGASAAGSAKSGGAADRVRAITAGDVSAGWSDSADTTPVPAAAADVVDPYGPDDPAYGPPGPDWRKRDEQRRTETAEPHPVLAEPRAVRGPFEPLRPEDRKETEYPDDQSADGEPAFDGPDAAADLSESEISEYQPIDYEMSLSELPDFGTPADPEAGALGQIADLYQTAERISPAGLDSHFEQLLERQRELIAEYFKESGGLGSAGAPETPLTQAEPSAQGIPLGFDTVESLSRLRDELRSAP